MIKSSKLWSATVFLILATFYGCEFQLDSENFLDIEEPNPDTQIQINLSPFETQYIFTVPTEVNYNLNTFGLTVYNVEFFVGEQSIHKGEEANGRFVFKPSPWGISTQTMTMVVTTNTNTGSLADILGAEGLVFQHSWEVLLDGGNPNPVEITDIFNDQGVLKLEWEEYTRFNFEKYVLYKNFGDAEAWWEKHVIAEITDPAVHHFYDSSFVGGTGKYWIEVYASNQKATSQEQQFEHSYPTIDTVRIDPNRIKFKWDKISFYGALDKTELTAPDIYPNPDIVHFSSQNTTDTSVIIENIPFGAPINYTLAFHPKTDISIYEDNQILRSSIEFATGTQIPEFSKAIVDSKNGLFYTFNNDDKITQYNIASGEQISSVNNNLVSTWHISKYDQSLCVFFNSNLCKYNFNNLEDKVTYDAYELGFNGFWVQSNFNQQNQMVGPVGFGMGIYDFTQKQMFFTDQQEDAWQYQFSDDGKFAFKIESLGYSDQKSISVFEFTGSELKFLGKLPAKNYSRYGWMDDSHTFYFVEGDERYGEGTNQFQLYNCETLSVEKTFSVNKGHLCGIDTRENLLAIWTVYPNSDTKKDMLFYNLDDGKLKKTVPLADGIDFLSFASSHIFSGKGFLMNINDMK